MNQQETELTVNTEVLEKMVSIAACEVAGVAGLCRRAVNLKAVKSGLPITGTKVETVNGAIEIQVYICVERDAAVRSVAEAVQQNVKEKIQNMTGVAVTKVNVTVADLAPEESAD